MKKWIVKVLSESIKEWLFWQLFDLKLKEDAEEMEELCKERIFNNTYDDVGLTLSDTPYKEYKILAEWAVQGKLVTSDLSSPLMRAVKISDYLKYLKLRRYIDIKY